MTQPYDPNQHIQVISRPGGLSGAAHAVHILICFFTCGLWIPGYIAFIVAAPNQRFEVVAPVGADPQLVARARLEAEARAKAKPGTPPPGPTQALPPGPLSRRGQLVVWAAIGGVLALVALAVYFVGGGTF